MINLNQHLKDCDYGQATEENLLLEDLLIQDIVKRSNESKVVKFSKEEVENGHYKILSPVTYHFEYLSDGSCEATKLNYWNDENYMAYQSQC